MAKMIEEVNNLLSLMDQEIETIKDTVSDILDIANLPGNNLQVQDLLVRAIHIIKNGIDHYKSDSLKIKALLKDESDKINVSSSSEEQMFDQSLEEDSQKATEESLSFRPHSEKTISKENLSFKEKKILLDIPILQSYVETQTSNMRDLYNLSRTDSRYVDFSGIYPRINYLQGSSPHEIRHWYDFGAINSIYLTSPDFPEISELPHWILLGVKDCYLNNPTITPKDTLILKFLSSGPDFYEENRYPAFHFIQLAKCEAFSISITNKKASFQKYCENDIHYRRALGIRIILQGMEAGFKKGFRTYGGNKIYSSVMISPAKTTPRSAENYLRTKIDLLDKGVIKSSPQAQHRICQYRGHTIGRCSSCSPSKDKKANEGTSVNLASDNE